MQQEKPNKEIITSNIINISKFISSSNEDTQNYLLFNEKLFLNHNSWLEKIKSQIIRAIKEQNTEINFTDINYNNEILNILRKIANPNDYRNNMNNNDEKKYKEDMEKFDKLIDFNDIIETTNKTCSKNKRDSLLAKIHNNNSNEINFNNNNLNNNKITFNENDKNLIDDDIIIDDIISSTQKVKLDSNGQVEKDENSLCTIVEQPSLEEMKKSNFSYKFTSNHLEEKKTGNYILDFNNNISNSNISNKLVNKSENSIINYNPLKLSGSMITPKKEEKENNINLHMNNINTNATPTYNINLTSNQFSFNKNAQQKDNSNKNIYINNKNEITFNLSSNKKNLIDFSSNKKLNEKVQMNLYQSNTKLKDTPPEVGTPTLNPNFESSNKKIDIDTNININNNNSNNLIKMLENNINKIPEEKNNVKNNNVISNNNINENISINNNSIKKNYVQELVLQSSSKKINDKNYIKNKKEKYLNDFEEYEMSDSSRRCEEEEEDEEDELNSKFIPKWAMDEEYIHSQLMKQNNNKNLVYKSFGNFVVEHLNLNMIFETHNDRFDVRNSTADWREDDSWTKNKVTDINNNDGNDIFPNRKLQFV